MPELPEVETIRRDLEQVVIGKKFTDVWFAKTKVIRESRRALRTALIGNQILRLERIGKLLMWCLQSCEYVLVHLKMTGQLFYVAGGAVTARGGHSFSQEADNILPNKYTRAVFTFANGGKLFFNDMRLFGFIALVNERKKQAITQRYGIEPLTKEFTLDNFSRIFSGRKTTLKSILLNQSLIAGIGNIYADEICFAANVKPTRIAEKLTKAQRLKLWQATTDVINRAITSRGTTFNSYVGGQGRQGNFVRQLSVYGRGGEPCIRCSVPLKKIRVAQRGTGDGCNCQS